MRAAACLLAAALLVPANARAELYKCRGPDGRTLFTSDRSQCPGAEKHEPSGKLQRAERSPAPSPRSATGRAAARIGASDDEVNAETWRAKRLQAEAELARADARLAKAHQAAGWCNRGGVVYAEDEDGLRRTVDCDDIEAKERDLRRDRERLSAYLEEGLEEECRREGCLPGWLR